MQEAPPMREFPNGRWSNHTPKLKDLWVKESFLSFVEERIRIEGNKAMKQAGINEFGERKHIKHRFRNHRDCATSYKNLFCWFNFPRCDPETGLTLPMCESACHNFFKACSYKADLKRCGKTEWFNGIEPESPSGIDADGNPEYLRDYFPGQPWVTNKYSQGGKELAVCTPAITGAAPSMKADIRLTSLLLLTVSVGAMLYSQVL